MVALFQTLADVPHLSPEAIEDSFMQMLMAGGKLAAPAQVKITYFFSEKYVLVV